MKALVVAILVFAVFLTISSMVASYSVGFDSPFGYVDLAHPLAGFAQPLQILGGLFAIITFIMMAKRKKQT